MKRWKHISLRKKILLCVTVIVLLGALIWALLDYPALTDEGYLRRAERAHLLPEGDILAKFSTEMGGSEFLAADGGEYIELCWLPVHNRAYNASGEGFYLYERQGDVTAVPLPTVVSKYKKDGILTGCMLLFDRRPEVQRVELSFTVDDSAAVYTSEAEREVGGVFFCYHEGPQLRDLWEDPTLATCYAKLYDATGILIEETEVPMGKLIS